MRDSGRHREQPIDEPELAGHERGMRGARQPLGEANNVFEPGFLGGDGKGDRALNHVGLERRTIVGALNVCQRVGDALDITHVGDRDLSPLRLQPRTAAIFSMHHGAHGITGLQQFSNDHTAGLPGRAGHEEPWLEHERLPAVWYPLVPEGGATVVLYGTDCQEKR